MPDPVNAPSPRQLDYIAKLSRSRGVSFARPTTKAAASRQIEALKAMPAGRTARTIERDLAAEVSPTPTLAVFREDEIDGYGASCHWSTNTGD